MGYTKDTIKGVSWMGVLRLATRGVAFVRIAILARILSPQDFGLFGIIILVLSFLEILTETGINVFLIQEDDSIDRYLNSAWIISILRGFVISIIVLLFTPLVVLFFNSPEAYKLLLLVSIVPFLRGFINPSVIKFQKELEFNKEFFYRFSIYFVESIFAIIFSFVTHSPIALVIGLISGAIYELVISFVVTKSRPGIKFEPDKIKSVINRGKWMTLSGIFQYFFQNGDNIVVGKILGTGSLGLYQTAYSLSTLPITEISEVFNKVTFPVYKRIGGERLRLKKAFLKVEIMISVFVIPIGIILFFFTEPIVRIVLGSKWLGSVGAIKVLVFFGIIRAIWGASSSLFLAIKKQEYVTVMTFAGIFGMGITIIPLVNKFGIVGAALAALVGSVVAIPVINYFLSKTFDQNDKK